MQKLLVFDWDGTLADSVNCIILCKQQLAKNYQLSIPSAEIIKSVLGMNFDLALERCFPKTNQEILKRFGKEFQALMQTAMYHADLFPQTKTTLNHLKEIGFKLAIATSKSRKELDGAIHQTGLDMMFDLTCCGEEYSSKPNPEMLLHIMNKLSVEPKDTTYIGDTVIDINFAKNANVDVTCVSFGACEEKELSEHHPTKIIHNWNDLLQGIEKNAI